MQAALQLPCSKCQISKTVSVFSILKLTGVQLAQFPKARAETIADFSLGSMYIKGISLPQFFSFFYWKKIKNNINYEIILFNTETNVANSVSLVLQHTHFVTCSKISNTQ